MNRVVVSGAVANKYRSGGAVWTRLNWALGFLQAGAEVCFVEQPDARRAVDEAGMPAPFHTCAPTSFFDRVMSEFGLAGSSALLLGNGEEIHGMSKKELLDVAALVNITGHLRAECLFVEFRRKAYIDLDPGYTQFWKESGLDHTQLGRHDL